MENTLLGVGLACVIAAIVGGGLKAFALELPLVNSLKRQSLLGLFGVTLLVAKMVAGGSELQADPKAKDPTNFDHGTWTLSGAIDDAGDRWDDSILKFTSQQPSEGGFKLQGQFTWRQNGKDFGVESISGNYTSATRQVILEGNLGSYSAILASDNRTLTDGRWGSTTGHVATPRGTWNAMR